MTKILHYFVTQCCLLQQHNMESTAKVLPEIADLLIAEDPTEQCFHVEKLIDGTCLVFRIKEWHDSCLREAKRKLASENERQEKYWTIDKVLELVAGMKKSLIGSAMSDEMLAMIAKKIINEKHVKLAEQYGVRELAFKKLEKLQ